MRTEGDTVDFGGSLPKHVDVVILGGGIVGASAALFLTLKGVSVALCEKGSIAGEQSSRNWGWIRKARRDPSELPLMLESSRIWRSLNELVGQETGYTECAHLFAAETDKTVAAYEDWLIRAQPFQVGARIVSGSELDRIMPGSSRHWKAALYSPNEAQAEPQYAASAIAKAAERNGAKVIQNCAVRGVEMEGGKLSAALTELGRIKCQTLVVSGGAWTSRFLQGLGVRLPQLSVRASVLRTAPLDGPRDVAVWCKEASFRRRMDGGYTIGNGFSAVAPIVPDSFRYFREFIPAYMMDRASIRLRIERSLFRELSEMGTRRSQTGSPFEKVRTLDPAPDRRLSDRSLDGLKAIFPVFSRAEVVEHWAGMIDVTPDMLPVISSVDTVPGLVIATGFSGHGFGIAPGAGKLVADLVYGRECAVDSHPFRYSRFTDRTGVRLTTGL